MLNSIVLMGRLVRAPELRHTNSGTPVASFRLAVERDFKGENGEKESDFIAVIAWRSPGEFVSKYFSKGKMAVVSGRLQMRNWTDKDGGKRTSAEVVADNVYFGSARTDGEHAGQAAFSGAEDSPRRVAGNASDFALLDGDDGELPF